MSRHVLVVINTSAGNGLAAKLYPDYFSFLKRRGYDFFPYYTTGRQDIENISKLLSVKDFDIVTVMGGDGTVNEVINANVKHNCFVHIIPCGSGNDLSEIISGKKLIKDHFFSVLNTTSELVDIFAVNDRYFSVTFGIGFDGEVCRTIEKNNALRIPKEFKYWIAILQNILSYKEIDIEVDGIEKKVFMLNLANIPRIGGGFKVAPRANKEDGKIDCITISKVPVLKRVKNLLRLKRGKHLGLSFVEYDQVQTISIYSKEVLPAQVDGELMFNKNYIVTLATQMRFLT